MPRDPNPNPNPNPNPMGSERLTVAADAHEEVHDSRPPYCATCYRMCPGRRWPSELIVLGGEDVLLAIVAEGKDRQARDLGCEWGWG